MLVAFEQERNTQKTELKQLFKNQLEIGKKEPRRD